MRDPEPESAAEDEPSQQKLDASELRESEENGEANVIQEFYDITPS